MITTTRTLNETLAAARDAHNIAMAVRGRGKSAAFADRNAALEAVLATGALPEEATHVDALALALGTDTVARITARYDALAEQAEEQETLGAIADCPARSTAKCTGSVGARYTGLDGVEHVYDRATESCTVCAPLPAPSREPGDTVTLTRAALIDLLTTAACLGRDASGSTRGEIAEYLAGYGLAVRRRLDTAVAAAITATSAQ